MRFTSPSRSIPPICLAIYGCGQLDRVADFINMNVKYTEDGVTFTAGMLAGQYAFEQVKLDRKGYDSRRLEKYLSFLRDAGAEFDVEEALHRADDLINNFTADFGHDEDGDATFRIKAQSYRLKKYDCHALWSMINQARLEIVSVTPEKFFDEDEDPASNFDSDSDSLDFRLTSHLVNQQGEIFSTLTQYYTVSDGVLTVEDLLDYDLTDYPNFHDESGRTYELMENIAQRNYAVCIQSVMDYFYRENKPLPEIMESQSIDTMILQRTHFSLTRN